MAEAVVVETAVAVVVATDTVVSLAGMQCR